MNKTSLIQSLQTHKHRTFLVALLLAALACWPTLTPNRSLVSAAVAAPNNCFQLLSDLADFDKSPATRGRERFIQFFLVSNASPRPMDYTPFVHPVEYIDGRLDWKPASGMTPESLSGQGLQYWNTERWGLLFQNPFDPIQANTLTVSILIADTDPPLEVTVGVGPGARKFVPQCQGHAFMYGFSASPLETPRMYVVTFRKAEDPPPLR